MATRLREWRRHRRVSLRELAKEANVAPSTLLRIEQGTLSPTLKMLAAVGLALHVSARDLIVKHWPCKTRRIRRPKGKRTRACLLVGLLVVLLSGAAVVTPQGELRDGAGNRLGTVKKDQWGGYSIYSTDGSRLGTARPNPWGGYDIYDRSGRRGLEQQQRERKR